MTSCEACKRAKRGVCRAHTGSLQRNLRDPVSREWWRRLDELVAVGERIATALERVAKALEAQHAVPLPLPCHHQWITGSTLGTRCGICGKLNP